MSFIFKFRRLLFRYFPRELFRLLCDAAVPFKRLSYFADYSTIWNVGVEDRTRPNERENDRRRRCLWWQVNGMLGYTMLLFFALYCLKFADDRVTNVTMWRVALFDVPYHTIGQDPEMKLAFGFLTSLAIYFNYRTYRNIDLEFLLYFDRIVLFRAGWRRFFFARRYLGVPIERLVRLVSLAIPNLLQLFILLIDIAAFTIILPKAIQVFGLYFVENQIFFGFVAWITFGFACATNCFIQIWSISMYAHLCILQASLGMVSLFILYMRISQNQVALQRKRWSMEAIFRFERFNVGSIELFSVANRTFANIFLAFLLFTVPANVYFVNEVTLNLINRSLGAKMLIYNGIGHQMLVIFCFHFFVAQLSKRFHRSGRLLSGLFARNHLVGSRRRVLHSPRFALRVSLLIARLHVKRRYGFLYGRIALVSMPLFFKFVLFYGEFWMYSYQQIRVHY